MPRRFRGSWYKSIVNTIMKKKLFSVISIVAITLLAACGDSNGGSMKPSEVKISGPLGEFFEVVDRGYSVKDGEINVEIKRIKEGLPTPWKEGMEIGRSDSGYEPHFTIEIRDKDGEIISKDKTQIILNGEELKNIMALAIDETASLKFKANNEGGVSFKIGSTFVVHGVSEVRGTYELKGRIDKYPVTMHIEIEGVQVNGNYYYNSQGPNALLTLNGTLSNGNMDLNETNSAGTPTGHFIGDFQNGVFKGKFVSYKGDAMPFVVAEEGVDISDISFDDTYIEDDEEDDYGSFSSSGSGSESIEELLDAYDRFVTKYISYAKKVAAGDATALAEYASLMEEAQEYSDKLKNCQGVMSNAQLKRYSQITLRMTKAMQEMQ